jgi:hypothetical protein
VAFQVNDLIVVFTNANKPENFKNAVSELLLGRETE